MNSQFGMNQTWTGHPLPLLPAFFATPTGLYTHITTVHVSLTLTPDPNPDPDSDSDPDPTPNPAGLRMRNNGNAGNEVPARPHSSSSPPRAPLIHSIAVLYVFCVELTGASLGRQRALCMPLCLPLWHQALALTLTLALALALALTLTLTVTLTLTLIGWHQVLHHLVLNKSLRSQ